MSDYAKAMADLWSAGGKAWLEAQEQATRAMTDGFGAMLAGQPPSAGDGKGPAVPAELAAAAAATMQLWSQATALSADLAGQLASRVGQPGDGIREAVLKRITDPRAWMAGTGELDDVLARLAEGPRLADLWDLERRYARVMRAWMDMRRRAFEHQGVVLEAWLRAGRQYAKELAAQTGPDDKKLDSKRAFAVWTETANHELLQTQRSEPFLRSQREMIRASTELRMAQSELVEHLGKQYGFPTRTELDDVHRTLTEMRRELRRLRRALADAPVQAPATPPPAPKPPAPEPIAPEPSVTLPRSAKRKAAS